MKLQVGFELHAVHKVPENEDRQMLLELKIGEELKKVFATLCVGEIVFKLRESTLEVDLAKF